MSPLLLAVVAYDIHRFNAQTVVAAFLVLSASAGCLRGAALVSGRWDGTASLVRVSGVPQR